MDDEPAGPELSDDTPVVPTPPPAPTQAAEDRTPFQRSVETAIAGRTAQGLPVPADVSYEYQYESSLPRAALQAGAARPGDRVTITAKTFIHFDHPAQAGNVRWPDLVVEGDVPTGAEGFIKAGDYTQYIKDKVEEQDPGIWQQYEFGFEPRTYTFYETYTITYPQPVAPAAPSAAASVAVTSLDEILMGFTVPGPNLNYSVEWDLEILGVTVIDFFAGFKLDWGLGVRLPMEVSLTSTEPMLEGSTYQPTSTARGLDWSAEDFAQAGVDPEGGNEFVMHFFFGFGVFLDVFPFGRVISIGLEPVDIDKSSSFATPFGPGAFFDLPSLDIILLDLPLAVVHGQIGFALTPLAGSERFTADWLASGEASGSGSLTYTDPIVPVELTSVNAIDGPGNADIKLSALRYHFNRLLLDLSLFFYLDVFGLWDGRFDVPITDFDLSAILGHLWVGVHSGTPGALSTSIFIENVAPTAEIDRGGTLPINGVPTFMTNAGNPLTFTGRAADPGRDDLTLSWDWDDGAPVPDISTTYPVPHQVTESQTHGFGAACMYWVGFKAVDDDLAFGEDHVPVIITLRGNRARSEGYWQHQFRGSGRTDFDAAALECYLAIIEHISTVFNEVRGAATIQQAHDVLFLKQNQGSEREQLDRELLVALLNFVNGANGYMELLDTDGDGIRETPFAQVIADAESVRLDPFATAAQLKKQTSILHHIPQMEGGGLPASKIEVAR